MSFDLEMSEEIPERFLPDRMRGELVEAEHLARYHWAARLCSGRRVLDAGCGAGYGSEIINAAGASEVVAVDSSEVAVELARRAVTPGVSCQIGDVADLEFPEDSFDAVVCFEVIEHVDDPQRVLDEFARVLRADGLLIISSPNRERYVPGNPHHVHELARKELQAMLDARFGAARIHSQHVMLASTVAGSDAPGLEEVPTLRPTPPAPEDELYLLAIAGSQLPPDPGPIVALGRFAEPRRWLEHIDGQRRYIEGQASRLRVAYDQERERHQALEQTAEAQSEIARLIAQTAELDAQTAELDARTAELDARIAELNTARGRLAEAEDENARLRAIVNSRTVRLARNLRRRAEPVIARLKA